MHIGFHRADADFSGRFVFIHESLILSLSNHRVRVNEKVPYGTSSIQTRCSRLNREF